MMLIQLFAVLLTVSCLDAVYLAKPHQNLYCAKGVAVVEATIVNKNKKGESYTVQLQQVFKPQLKKTLNIKTVQYVKSACGTNKDLVPGTVYVLSGIVTGKTLKISKCDSLIVTNPTIMQNSNYRGGYDCSCNVKFCEKEPCEGSMDMCTATFFESDCHNKYGVCKRIEGGKCDFTNLEDAEDYNSSCDPRLAMAMHMAMLGKK